MSEKRVLILSYYFPPYEFTGGQRAYSWYKHLKKFDISPVIITRHWDTIKKQYDNIKPSSKQEVEILNENYGTVIRIPFNPNRSDRYVVKHLSKDSLIAKILSLFNGTRYWNFSFDKTANIFYAADEYLKINKCDLIIASGSPFILFRYAHILSKKNKIPWIADYRDCWSDNTSLSYAGFLRKFLFKVVVKNVELKYVSTASVITTVVEPYREKLHVLFPDKTIEVIHNGYNHENLIAAKNIVQESENFTIAYAGTIYPYQKLEVFLEGLVLFIKQLNCSDVRVIFYGLNYDKKQLKRLTSYSKHLDNYIVATDKCAKRELFKQIAKAHLLVLLSDKKTNTGASKIFDYLALNRKIMLVPDDNSVMSKIIDEHHAGVKCSTPDEVKNSLVQFYNEFKTQRRISHQTKNIEKYQWQNQVELMSKIILNVN